MRILFLGTGAADWPDPGAKVNGGRRYASLRLYDNILIDCNERTLEAIDEFCVDVNKLTDIVISHPHGDHFNFEAIEKIAVKRSGELAPLQLWVNKKATERAVPTISKGRLVVNPYLPGDSFKCTGADFLTLPANHSLEIPGELAAHLVITTQSGEKLYYALDGSWLPKQSWGMLRKLNQPMDYIIWEMTCGDLDDWRLFEHCNLGMIAIMSAAFHNFGVAKPDTVMFASHIMMGACGNMEALRKTALDKGFIVAEDGMYYDSNNK